MPALTRAFEDEGKKTLSFLFSLSLSLSPVPVHESIPLLLFKAHHPIRFLYLDLLLLAFLLLTCMQIGQHSVSLIWER